MEAGLEAVAIALAILVIAALYASVGHGGASGYLAILSLTSFAAMSDAWLKQHVWCLNMVVAAIAFHHYRSEGHHLRRLTAPFVLASVPFAFIGGSIAVSGTIYDVLLSFTLLWAAWRLWAVGYSDDIEGALPHPAIAAPIGGSIGFLSGLIGVGGGIFLSPIVLLKRWAAPKAVAATAAVFIWVNSAAGLAGSVASGRLEVEVAIVGPFTLAVLVGGLIGARYGAVVAPQSTIRRLLVAVLVIAAARRVLAMIGLWP